MKKKGSICEFGDERDAALVKCFRKRLGEVMTIDLDRIFREVASHHAPRFYVSEYRASAVIRHHLRHGVWNVKGEKRREMFREIEKRVLRLLEENEGMPFEDAIVAVVNSAAPEFYLTPRFCRTLIYKRLKKCR